LQFFGKIILEQLIYLFTVRLSEQVASTNGGHHLNLHKKIKNCLFPVNCELLEKRFFLFV